MAQNDPQMVDLLSDPNTINQSIEKVNLKKPKTNKHAKRQKSMQIYPACKELNNLKREVNTISSF